MANSRSLTVSAAALSAFAAVALVIPSALATPNANGTTNSAASTSAAAVCLTPETDQRLSDAVKQASAAAMLRKADLDTAQAKADTQEKLVKGLEAEREKIIHKLEAILITAYNEANVAKADADEKHQLAQDALAAAKEEINDLNIAIQELKEQVANLRAQKSANEAGTDALSQAAKTEEDAVANAAKELPKKAEALRVATEQFNAAQAELESTQRQLAAATTARDEATRSLENARNALTQAQASLEGKKAKNDELKAHGGKAGIERKVQEAQASFDQATQAAAEHETLITAAADKVTKAEQAKQQAEADLAPVKEASKVRLEKIANFETALAAARDAQARAERIVDGSANELATITGELATLNPDITAHEQAIERLEEEKTTLDREISELNAEIRALKAAPAPDQQQVAEKEQQLAQKQARREAVTAEIVTETTDKNALEERRGSLNDRSAVLNDTIQRETQVKNEAEQRVQTLTQSIADERSLLNQEQPTLEGLQQAFDDALQKHTEEVAAHEALVAERPAKEQAKQETQTASEAANAIKTAYGTDFDGDIDTQYQQAEDEARQLAEQAAQTVTTREGELSAKQEQVDTLTAGVGTHTADRDAKEALKKAAEEADLAARNAHTAAQARLTQATEARTAGHAKTVTDLTAAEDALSTEEAKVAPATAVVGEKEAAAGETAKKKAEAETILAALNALKPGDGVQRPLEDPSLADLEKELSEVRGGLAVSDAARTRLYTYRSTRNMMRDSFQAAQTEVERAQADLAEAKKLPRCTEQADPKDSGSQGPKDSGSQGPKDSGSQGPKEQKSQPQVEAARTSQAKAPQRKEQGAQHELAKTGATDLSGVALLSAMVGAGALVAVSRRRSSR